MKNVSNLFQKHPNSSFFKSISKNETFHYFFARYAYFIFKNIAIFVQEISFQHIGFEIFCIYITPFNCLIYE